MKKTISVLILAAMIMLLGACGGSQGSSSDQSSKQAKRVRVSDMTVEVPESWKVKKVQEEEYDAQLIFHGDVDENGTYGDDWTSCIIDEEVTPEEGQTPEELYEEYTAQIEQQIRESEETTKVKVKDETSDGIPIRIITYKTRDGIDVREAFLLMDGRVISVTMDSTIVEDAEQFEDIVKSIRM